MSRILLASLILFLVECQNSSDTNNVDSSKLSQANEKKLLKWIKKNSFNANFIDETGKRQGLWMETDSVTHTLTKEMYYHNNLLDSLYLELKVGTIDTLVLGNYNSGMKQGEWKYWSIFHKGLDRVEVYENNVLIETKKY